MTNVNASNGTNGSAGTTPGGPNPSSGPYVSRLLGDDVAGPFANNPLAAIVLEAMGALGDPQAVDEEDGRTFADRLDKIHALMTHATDLSPAELDTLINFGIDMATRFPDSERGAAMGAALIAGVAQALIDSPRMAEALSPALRSRLAGLAAAIDDAAPDRLQSLLAFAGDDERFVELANHPSATSMLKAALGAHYVAPPTGGPPPFQPMGEMTYDALLAQAMSDPLFALIFLALEADETRREQMAATLRANFEPSEKTMMLLQKGLEDSGNFRKALMGVLDTAKEGDSTVADGFR